MEHLSHFCETKSGYVEVSLLRKGLKKTLRKHFNYSEKALKLLVVV